MKNNRNLLLSIITVALALLVIIGSVFSTSAITVQEYKPTFNPQALASYNEQGHGSFDQGVVAPFGFYKWYHPSIQYMDPTIDGHPNLNFEKGYEFWHDNSAQVKINTETLADGKKNSYATIIGQKEHSGISTVKFMNSKIKEGDTLAVLYKWRAPSHQRAVEAYLEQLTRVTDETNDNHKSGSQVGLSVYDGRNEIHIWVADEEDDKEWNISLSNVCKPVAAPTGDYPFTYFNVGFQATLNYEFFKDTDVDDIQIVKFEQDLGLVKDLDGNLLYNTNNLPKRDVVDYDFKDLGETDPKADKKVDMNAILSGKVELNVGSDSQNDNSSDQSGIALWIWIVIAVGVVIILAVAVVVIIVVSKKKKSSATCEEAETSEEATVENADSEE